MDLILLGPHLSQLTTSATLAMRSLPIVIWDADRGQGAWTRREIVGHLIDSAANNHQRFVRALSQPELVWPGYDQVEHVRVQRFRWAPQDVLVDLWSSFNQYLALLIGQIPPDRRGISCSIGGAAPMTLEELAVDYVAHLEHHVRQVLAGVDADLQYSGLPWPPNERAASWPV